MRRGASQVPRTLGVGTPSGLVRGTNACGQHGAGGHQKIPLSSGRRFLAAAELNPHSVRGLLASTSTLQACRPSWKTVGSRKGGRGLWERERATCGAARAYSTSSSSVPTDSYYGETDAQGRPHGKGRMRLADGATLEGDWVNGSLVRGKLMNMEATTSEQIGSGAGMMYEGEFYDGLFHGYGTACSPDHVYVGQWVSGVPHGRGRFVSPLEGRTYEGDIQYGRPHGKGRETDEPSETTYDGEFKDGYKHGNGIMQSPHHRYEGEWRNDRMEGRGKMRWKSSRLPNCDEEEYEGEWQAGLHHGSGVLTVYDYKGRKKLVHEGEWRNGLKDGPGRELSPKGVVLREGRWFRGVFLDEVQDKPKEEKPKRGRKATKGEMTNMKKERSETKADNGKESSQSTPELGAKKRGRKAKTDASEATNDSAEKLKRKKPASSKA